MRDNFSLDLESTRATHEQKYFIIYLFQIIKFEYFNLSHSNRWMAIILVALIFFNGKLFSYLFYFGKKNLNPNFILEPFYSLRFIVGGFLLQIIGTAFEVLFEAILLIFWLDSIDRISKVFLSFFWMDLFLFIYLFRMSYKELL